MLETSARLLRLLSLLQSRRSWPGPELARSLEVTERTVRRDIDKLRSLGYPVDATAGAAGGYRLAAGTRLPPLLLDDNEALAVAFALRSAAVGTVSGMEEHALRALDKLGQVLPERLRKRVAALQVSFVATPFTGPRVDPDVLTRLAGACEDQRCLRFAYRDAKGHESERHVEPHGVVHTLARWYLVCWDLARADWRTFRVDRLRRPTLAQPFALRREVPTGDLAAFVAEATGPRGRPFQAVIELLAPLEQVQDWLPQGVGRLSALGAERCLLETGAWELERLAYHLLNIRVDYVVREPPELVASLVRIAERVNRAVQASVDPRTTPSPTTER